MSDGQNCAEHQIALMYQLVFDGLDELKNNVIKDANRDWLMLECTAYGALRSA